MYCADCGKQIDDDSAYCKYCGAQTGAEKAPADANKPPTGYYYATDEESKGHAVLGFFFPVVGFILWLVWQDKYRKRAKSCGKGALIGAIVWTALSVIMMLISFFAVL